MQKNFKRLLVVFIAIVATICVGLSLAACTAEKPTDYTITVTYPDGKAVNGETDGKNPYDPDDKTISVQICVVQANGETGMCSSKSNVGTDGKVTIEAPKYTLKEGEKFKIQINNVPEGYKCEQDGSYYSAANYVTEPGSYTVKLESK